MMKQPQLRNHEALKDDANSLLLLLLLSMLIRRLSLNDVLANRSVEKVRYPLESRDDLMNEMLMSHYCVEKNENQVDSMSIKPKTSMSRKVEQNLVSVERKNFFCLKNRLLIVDHHKYLFHSISPINNNYLSSMMLVSLNSYSTLTTKLAMINHCNHNNY